MTETREDIMERLVPGYEETRRVLESYSDWELGLIMDNIPECPEDLEDSIIKEVQWSIVDTLFEQFINNWMTLSRITKAQSWTIAMMLYFQDITTKINHT